MTLVTNNWRMKYTFSECLAHASAITATIQGGSGKSLARPGRKQATVTKLGIYSTYSPRSSIHILALCSNFCKLLKKNSESCPSNQVSAAAMTSASDKKGLDEIRWSSNISSWIWSIISGLVTVLSRPGRGASQVEKSPLLNWVTQFLMVAYDGACSPNVSLRMTWIFFGALSCKQKTWWQLTSWCCWNCVCRLTCFLSISVTRKDLQFGTWTEPSFQWHYRFRPTTSGSRSG